MGKPSPILPRPGDDPVSLHTQAHNIDGPSDAYVDDDALDLQSDDLPPFYDEAASSAPLLATATATAQPPSSILRHYRKDDCDGAEYYLDSRLDTDPKLLEEHIHWWAKSPPRPYVQILGTHREVVNNAGKEEEETVTDFDVRIELTPYLYSNATRQLCWRELRTVENTEKTWRGTILRRRDPSAAKGPQLDSPKPSLAEWCHRYCASHAGLKCFTFRRSMVGFDKAHVKQKLVTLARSTGYRGSINIHFPVRDASVEVYNQCRTNEWRLTTWILWLCVLTAMFLLTWPYLFFRTKRFDVVAAEWAFSEPTPDGGRRFVSISEDQWYNMWGRAIYRAVLEKRRCTLDQQDLLSSDGTDIKFGNAAGDADTVRASINAMNEVNRQLGWGGDS